MPNFTDGRFYSPFPFQSKSGETSNKVLSGYIESESLFSENIAWASVKNFDGIFRNLWSHYYISMDVQMREKL
jgi:hypothetical protein